MLTRLVERYPVLKGMLDFLYPPLCPGCAGYNDSEPTICPQCLAIIDWNTEPVALTDLDFRLPDDSEGSARTFPLFAGGDYSGPLREAVIGFKFRGVRSIAVQLAGEIVQRQGAAIRKLSPAALVPVPLHPSREYVRGYNQASLLASELAPLIDLPVDANLLIRSKKRRPQARLKQARRATNIRGAFELAPDYELLEHAERVILVDDVVTSGQTVFEAKRTLARAEILVVGVIAIAHRR